jgi:chromosome segregation ATPase
MYKMNTRELENRIIELDNRFTKKLEDHREQANKEFLHKTYYDAKHDVLVDKVDRLDKVTKDAYNVMNEFNAHKGRLTLVEGEISKLQTAIELVDQKSEARHEKVMNALDAGLNKIDTKLNDRTPRLFNVGVAALGAVLAIINIILIASQHIH